VLRRDARVHCLLGLHLDERRAVRVLRSDADLDSGVREFVERRVRISFASNAVSLPQCLRVAMRDVTSDERGIEALLRFLSQFAASEKQKLLRFMTRHKAQIIFT
jgi:hypothetical protein